MSESDPVIRNVSDTARWTAAFRARESERPDALFRDPLARKLAGERGERIAQKVTFGTKHTWSFITRTYLLDQFLAAEIQRGADMVINLAAGLDTRPYRMDVPASLQWIEVDLPGILEYKEEVLKNDRPKCSLRRVPMDLADQTARRSLFNELGTQVANAVIVTEGLLIYLDPADVGELARDLATPRTFRRWILDLASPGLVRMLQKKMGSELDRAGAPLKFGAEEGPAFFEKYGWKTVEVRSMLHSAAMLGRLPFLMRLFAFFPPPKDGRAGNRPWSGACLLERQ